ncbi:MAG TPA: YdjY domain-containing protein [Pirellulaceae bacterium]|nr:YdjY domain-containing protein [Pirellulaceae bacterium]
MSRFIPLAALALILSGSVWLHAQEAAPATKLVDPTADIPTPETPKPPEDPNEAPKESLSPDIPGLTRLSKDGDIWIDMKRKIVVMDGRIACREGQLEMFACPRGTKEHESVVAVNAKPSIAHAALLAVGAKAGTPVKFDPKYVPASGTTVEILVLWKDKDGKNQKMRAQEFIKQIKTGKAMEYDWVFAGSGFWLDEETGVKHYHGDSGDFICVSNFPTATLDLPVKSSQENTNLLFEANTAKIPAKGTKVRLVMIPQPEKKAEEKKDAPEQPKPEVKSEETK